MRYKKDYFTEQEIKAVIDIAEKVCMFVGVTIDDLLSSSRKAELVKARYIIAHYQYHNVLISKFRYKKSYSLSCWYLDKDHTTGLHYVELCEDIYRFNNHFRNQYDLISFFIKNPEQIVGKINLDMRWSNIKADASVPNVDKLAQLPYDVKQTIENYLYKRYSYGYIADKVGTNDSFIEFFATHHKIRKESLKSVGVETMREPKMIRRQPLLFVGR